jgi:hypothetical protein
VYTFLGHSVYTRGSSRRKLNILKTSSKLNWHLLQETCRQICRELLEAPCETFRCARYESRELTTDICFYKWCNCRYQLICGFFLCGYKCFNYHRRRFLLICFNINIIRLICLNLLLLCSLLNRSNVRWEKGAVLLCCFALSLCKVVTDGCAQHRRALFVDPLHLTCMSFVLSLFKWMDRVWGYVNYDVIKILFHLHCRGYQGRS